ncbi:MAG TPA: hypothetical protein VIK54_18640, partial [Acidimicrobiia bacterium]
MVGVVELLAIGGAVVGDAVVGGDVTVVPVLAVVVGPVGVAGAVEGTETGFVAGGLVTLGAFGQCRTTPPGQKIP